MTVKRKPTKPFSMRLLSAQMEAIKRAAALEMMSPSAWARRVLVRTAEAALKAHDA